MYILPNLTEADVKNNKGKAYKYGEEIPLSRRRNYLDHR